MHLRAIYFYLIFSVKFLLLSASASAAENTAETSLANSLLQQIETKKLWKNLQWLNLIHYKLIDEKYISAVDDSRYFISSNGKHNPKHELIETIRAFYNPDLLQPDNHAQCRFVARLNWLQSQLDTALSDLPNVHCAEYEAWRKEIPAYKTTLIFPAYHLNSPSSMFGHTLLRIDSATAENKGNTTWLSQAVNFGANIREEDNSLQFAIKGLAGGYAGNFIVTPYYKKIKEYNRNENRDIWEYPLNLTPEETERIVLHLWELKGMNFRYYFFDENCSYRLLELLEVARPGLELTDHFGLSAIPVDTVRSIKKSNLINNIQYRPSQVTNINFLLDQLTSNQKQLAYELSRDTKLLHSQNFHQLDTEDQSIILDTAYRYLRYQQNDTGRTEINAENSFQILKAINKRENFSSMQAGFSSNQKPEDGHLSKRISINTGKDDDQNFLQLDFRMSFHSLEDRLEGFLEGAQINFGSISVRATKDEAQIQQLDIIDIFSLTPRNTFFKPLSWRVYTGLEQQLINTKDHLTAHVTGGAGVTYKLWPAGYTYLLATARLESNSQFSRAIEPALGYTSGLLHHFKSGTSHLEISGEEFSNDEYRHRVKFSHNMPLSTNHAIRLSVLEQRQIGISFTEAQIGYNYFFH